MCFARRNHSYATSAQEAKPWSEGFAFQQDFSFSKIGLDLANPRPSRYHMLSIALKEGAMWTRGYYGTKGYKQAVFVPVLVDAYGWIIF